MAYFENPKVNINTINELVTKNRQNQLGPVDSHVAIRSA